MKRSRKGPGRPRSSGGRVTPKAEREAAGSPAGTLTLPRSAGGTTKRIGPPVRPGRVGQGRPVPDEIPRPPYAEEPDGYPPPFRGSNVATPEVVERMRRAGALAAEVLIKAGDAVVPGVTTDHIDAVVHQATIDAGAYPSPLRYKGFPKSVCTSVNEVICHGIPDDRPLRDGDILNVDVTVFLDGVHGDTNATFLVGEVDDDSRRLIRVTREAMLAGIDAVRPGLPINVIGRAIENHAHRNGIGVVREFIGHGINTVFHTSLQIPHYYDSRARTRIEPGMTFTIEPMLTLGSPALHVWDDHWTAVTNDGSRSAQFEHTIVVTDDGAEILTRTADGRTAAETFAV